ncbi:hypothetical protein [Kitasatospora sp. NBC_01302]|uniref:hypothetical protein n=1 Tax=Kitasatospora sp. NBC_01302 TaxID=2903575 RepID=UPI002E103510|nr:hypothetical protein OG294_13895 [Kitasatospora sp. NBC_01302]
MSQSSFPMPPAEELDRMRHELANSLLAMQQQLAPVFDAADGIRADMEQRGWSPTAAESVALTWLQGTIALITTGGGR